jgi:hypothetical protein
MASEQTRRHRGFFLIPAGFLIGLGIGILVGYIWSGMLVGIGAGFLGSVGKRGREIAYQDPTVRPHTMGGQRLILLLVGLYIIFSGIAIIWIPREIWQNFAAVFFILIGIWFIVRGYGRGN